MFWSFFPGGSTLIIILEFNISSPPKISSALPPLNNSLKVSPKFSFKILKFSLNNSCIWIVISSITPISSSLAFCKSNSWDDINSYFSQTSSYSTIADKFTVPKEAIFDLSIEISSFKSLTLSTSIAISFASARVKFNSVFNLLYNDSCSLSILANCIALLLSSPSSILIASIISLVELSLTLYSSLILTFKISSSLKIFSSSITLTSISFNTFFLLLTSSPKAFILSLLLAIPTNNCFIFTSFSLISKFLDDNCILWPWRLSSNVALLTFKLTNNSFCLSLSLVLLTNSSSITFNLSLRSSLFASNLFNSSFLISSFSIKYLILRLFSSISFFAFSIPLLSLSPSLTSAFISPSKTVNSMFLLCISSLLFNISSSNSLIVRFISLNTLTSLL